MVVEQYQAKNATTLLAVDHYSPLVVEQYQAPWVQSKLNSYAEWKPPRQPSQIQTYTTGATSTGVLHKQNPPSMQPLNMEGSQQRQERRGPACRDLDSTIVFVPRQMERQESNSLDISNEGNTFPKRSSKLTDLNQVQATQSYLQPYEYDNTMPQQSPNPQGMVNIAFPSIEEILGTKPMELKNMSQELQELAIDKPPSVQPLNMEASQQRQGKRAATEAKLDSGSKVVPRKEDRQSNSLNTPTNSDTLSTGDVRFTSKDLRDPSAVLKNCPEVNQL